jgi:hypothetical protein
MSSAIFRENRHVKKKSGIWISVLWKNPSATNRLSDEIKIYEAGTFLGYFETSEPAFCQTVVLQQWALLFHIQEAQLQNLGQSGHLLS